jgi:hypothetical protein
MVRIAYRALVLLVCAVMLVGLIAARPLIASVGPAFQRSSSKHLQLPAIAEPQPPDVSNARVATSEQAAQPPRAEPRPGLETDVPMRLQRAAAPPATAAPAVIAGNGPWMRGQLVRQTERLDFYVGKNTFSADQVAELAPKIELALRNAEQHFGTTLTHRVSLGFYRVPPKRGVRGMAYTAEQRAALFYRPAEDPGRALTIAAHELGHHLEAQRYGEDVQRRADTILHEGMATWIAADRWLPMCEATTWRQRARQLHNAGVPLRLLTAERSGADNAYELWASFVDFLAERYGWDKLDALYASGRGRAPGSANYQKILGKSLDELADEWRNWVNQE